MSLPDDLVSVNPAFSTCGGFVEAVGDPPRALGPATALVPSITPVAPSLAASPGAQVGPATAAPTPVPTPKDPNIKVPVPVPPIDPQESDPQPSDPQDATSESQGGSPVNKPDVAGDPDPSIDTNKGAAPGAVKGSGGGVSQQSKDNNVGNLLAGTEIQYDDSASLTQGVTENDADLSMPSINGQEVQAVPGGGVMIGTSTVRPGDQITQDGTTVFVRTDSILIDGTAYALPSNVITKPLVVSGQTIVKDSNGGIIVGTATYTLGTNTQVSGMSLSVGPDNVVIDGTTYTLPVDPDPPAGQSIPLLVGGEPVRRAADGGVLVGSSSIAAGTLATVSGHVISVVSSSVVVDGTAFPLAATPTPIDTFLIGGEPVRRAADGGVWIGVSSIAAGAQSTVSGHVISAAASSVVVDGTAFPLAATPVPITDSVLNGKSIRRAADGGVLIGSAPLPLGSIATVAGNVISVGASSVMVDGTLYPLPTAAGAILQQGNNVEPKTLTLANGAVITAGGAAATISGTTYSIPADDSGLVVNGKTLPFPPKDPTTTTASGAIGGLIVSGFGNGADKAMEFTGGGGVVLSKNWMMILVAGEVVMMMGAAVIGL